MSGLEKILNEIHSDAERESREILEKAQAEEKDILARAEKDAAEMKTAAQEKGKQLLASQRERSQSAAALRVRQRLLREKQSLVQETLALAEKQLLERPTAEYFGNLLSLLKEAVQPEKGTLYLSERDLKRLPEGFVKQMESIANAKGGSLTLSSEARKLNGGFVLEYGGIEENCSYAAMFTAERERLEDIISAQLFAEAESE